MSIHLYLAPAGHGKTTFVAQQLQEAVQDLRRTPQVCVATAWQARAWRRLLARQGAIGIHVRTFTELYQGCLDHAGRPGAILPEAVQQRLLQRVVDGLVEAGELQIYHTLRHKPGFIQAVQALINEFRTARISPQSFLEAASSPRLGDLARIYQRYRAELAPFEQGQPALSDAAGLAERALAALQEGCGCPPTWSLIAFDGFDVLNPLRVAFVKALGARYNVLITLTGPADGHYSRPVHERFRETYRRLQQELAPAEWSPQPLPQAAAPQQPALAHLEANLFQPAAATYRSHGAVHCHVAPDRAGEVGQALHWLKERVVVDGLPLEEVALVAREVEPYRALIRETAVALGLPLRFENGLPLAQNPAVAALLDLLRLFRPRPGGSGWALPRSGVVAAWRSPYFDWAQALDSELTPQDAERLQAAALWGRVEGGYRPWVRALRTLSHRQGRHGGAAGRRVPRPVPIGQNARRLRLAWCRFLRYMAWTRGRHEPRYFVRQLERLLGAEEGPQPGSLNIAHCARQHEETAVADVAALRALKEQLRGLLWAAETGATPSLPFAAFLDQLEAAVQNAAYEPAAARPALTVARAFDARGVSLQAVAALGLAEGQFPPPLHEEALLQDADRAALNERLPQQSPFRLRLEQDERPYFYDLVTRPRHKLLLTRPHRADDGSEWPPSAYWEEVQRRLPDAVPPQSGALSQPIALAPAATGALSLAADGQIRVDTGRWQALVQAAAIFRQRYGGEKGLHDGHCYPLAPLFQHLHGPDYPWSPSQLEKYTTCPFRFFVEKRLGLSRQDEPEEDPQIYHLGNIYHRIFQELFSASRANPGPGATPGAGPQPAPPTLEELEQRLERVAGAVLDDAPARFGFRPPAWWPQLRQRIQDDVARSLPRLLAAGPDFYPVALEESFEVQLTLPENGDPFKLRGIVDRVDRVHRDGDGDGPMRLVDYKLGSPASHDKKALQEGRKIQLPLYALALQSRYRLDEPPDGFYWHVRHAQASDPLSAQEDGVEGAVALALHYAGQAIAGARQGHFQPGPPSQGCPGYCTAAAFCWHFTPRFGG